MKTEPEFGSQGLWNDSVTSDSYGSREQYNKHIFEQYKLMVDSADKISARRNLANTFFLTLHTFLIGAAGFIHEKGPAVRSAWFNIFLLIAVLSLCYMWHRLLISYRQLNAAKFQVIRDFETRLPSSPFWNAEWDYLGRGTNPKLYRALTDIERFVPSLFAVLYLIAFITILLF